MEDLMNSLEGATIDRACALLCCEKAAIGAEISRDYVSIMRHTDGMPDDLKQAVGGLYDVMTEFLVSLAILSEKIAVYDEVADAPVEPSTAEE